LLSTRCCWYHGNERLKFFIFIVNIGTHPQCSLQNKLSFHVQTLFSCSNSLLNMSIPLNCHLWLDEIRIIQVLPYNLKQITCPHENLKVNDSVFKVW
jgi:hypothetical protein